MNANNFTTAIPTVPGIFLRNDGALLLVSIEAHFDGSRAVRARDITPKWVPAAPRIAVTTFLKLDEHLGDAAPSFSGPLNLAPKPVLTTLESVRDNAQRPSEPGLFWMSRNLGHAWISTLVTVSIHRFTTRIRVPDTDELFGVELPKGEKVEVRADRNCIFTPALPISRLSDGGPTQITVVPASSSVVCGSPNATQAVSRQCAACGISPDGGVPLINGRCGVCGGALLRPSGGGGSQITVVPNVPRH